MPIHDTQVQVDSMSIAHTHPSEDKNIMTTNANEEKAIIAANDVDEALRYLDNNDDVDEGTVMAVDDKKLMRKVDWMLAPLMFSCYYMQYTDKTLCLSTRKCHSRATLMFR